MRPKPRSKRHLLKWQENTIQIEILTLLLKINSPVFLKHIRLFLMTKREKFTTNMVWELTSRNNTKIWVFREIVVLEDLAILAIFGVNNNNKEDSRIYSMILRISSLLEDKEKIKIDQKEA